MIADDEQDTARPGGFDPRYDPAFQRGYRPQPGERARTRVRAVTPAPTRDRPRADARAAASAPQTVEDAWEATATPASELPVATDPVPFTTVSTPVPALAAEPATVVVAGPGLLAGAELSPRRNPLMLALWIVGAGLVVLGIVIYAVAVNASYTTSYNGAAGDVGMQVLTQIGWVLAGPMITIGFATLVALLFITALAGRRRAGAAGAGAEDDGEPQDDEL
ncbi:hypothetical protein ACI2IX_17445 [Leifsonia aquatica]|uniref:hypothetical protein n=1 Tax=Leifsonia aquatica TaxID=144185 RepID=UPI00384B06C1